MVENCSMCQGGPRRARRSKAGQGHDSAVAWWTPPGESARARRLPAGLGLEFRDISEVDLGRIRALVLEHCRGDLSARRFHPAWPEARGDAAAGE